MTLHDSATASARMARVRSRGTAPELTLRRALFTVGLRYRLNDPELPGKPDITFRRARVAVFVDGEFWHGRQWQDRGLRTLADAFHSNSDYWTKKIQRNVERDALVNQQLGALGWLPYRVWAGDVERQPAATAKAIARTVREREAAFAARDIAPSRKL